MKRQFQSSFRDMMPAGTPSGTHLPSTEDLTSMLAVLAAGLDTLEFADEQEAIKLRRKMRMALLNSARLVSKWSVPAANSPLQELVDVPELIKHLMDQIQSGIPVEVEFEKILETGLWPVRVAPASFASALSALLENAFLAAGGNGGKVSLRLRNRPAIDAIPERIEIEVADNGPGLRRDTIALAFEPFYSNWGADHRLGLGLTHAQRFAQKSGGSISLVPRSPRGVRAVLWLPRAYDHSASRSSQSADVILLR